MSNLVWDSAAVKSVKAAVILKGSRYVGKVITVYGKGTCLVNVFQATEAAERSAKAAEKAGTPLQSDKYNSPGHFQKARCGGGGYDFQAAALSGMYIDGHKLTDHCGESLPPPKGRKTWPRDAKAPRGYSLANWSYVSKSTGRSMHSYTWRDRAQDQLGVPANPRGMTDSEWAAVADLADKMRSEWEASDDCEMGYTSCHKHAGLRYLSEIGYTVIEAIP